jgi:hypothetical protein
MRLEVPRVAAPGIGNARSQFLEPSIRNRPFRRRTHSCVGEGRRGADEALLEAFFLCR